MQKMKFLVIPILLCSSFQAHSDLVKTSIFDDQQTNLIIEKNIAAHAIEKLEEPTLIRIAKSKSEQSQSGVIDRLNQVASNAVKNFSQTGLASWYGRQFHGRKTASGETFNMHAMTAAHKSLPLNCLIKVTNEKTGKSVIVKVNDRGPFHGNRVVDLSYAAAKAIGITNDGVAKVKVERVS